MLNLVHLKDDVRCDNVIIQTVIMDSLQILWPSKIHYDRLLLLISDQASYMCSAARAMKLGCFPTLMHVTCLAHALHGVCELARNEYKQVAQLIADFSIVFSHCRRRRNGLRVKLGSSPPTLPVATRWGTWVKFACFIHKNDSSIHEFLIEILAEGNQSIDRTHSALEDPLVLGMLSKVPNLEFVADNIKLLEKENLQRENYKKVIDTTLERLNSILEIDKNGDESPFQIAISKNSENF